MTARFYVDGPSGQLHGRQAGTPSADRPSLICFHMSPMSSRTFERFLDTWAAAGGHGVAFDTPGFGMSDAPAEPPAIADYAATLLAGIDALGLAGPVDLMGYHTGSMIACEIAATRPERVRRLVCVATPIFTVDERAELAAHYRAEPPVAADGSHLTRIWQGFHHHFTAGGAPLDLIADAFPERLLGRDTAWWGHAAAFAFADDMRLPEIAQPILVLNPQDDLEHQTRRAAPLLRDGRIVDLPGWGHGFLDLHTADAVTLIREFLA